MQSYRIKGKFGLYRQLSFRGISFLILFGASLLCGCSSKDFVDTDFKTSIWEDLWLDGNESLAEGRAADARTRLEAALKEARSLPPDNMRLGITLDRLADAYLASDMKKEAYSAYSEAVKAFDTCIASNKSVAIEKLVLKEQVGSLSNLGKLLYERKQYSQAEKVLKKAVVKAQRLGGSQMTETKDRLLVSEFGAIYKTLGQVYEKQGLEADAAAIYKEATHFLPEPALKADASDVLKKVLGIHRSSSGADLVEEQRNNELIRAWRPLQDMGLDALQSKDTDAAIDYFRKGYLMARKVDPIGPQAMDSLNMLLRALGRARQFDESDRLIKETLPLMAGHASKSIDNVLGEIARVYEHQRRWKDIPMIIKERLRVRELIRGPEHFHVAESYYDLGGAYIDLQEYSQAEMAFNKALKIMASNNRLDHELAKKIQNRLIQLKDPSSIRKRDEG